MAKSRVSRKSKNFMARTERIERAKQSFKVATQVRFMAEALTNQALLDTCLLQQPDLEMRQKMFAFMKPFLKFPNPVCPSPMNITTDSGIVMPFPR